MITFREMTIEDYEEVYRLWLSTTGIGLSSADQPEFINFYLKRNPGFSFVAQDNHKIIGAVLCGHDGRRGYIHHLAVYDVHRRKGIGRQLVQRCLKKLYQDKIQKCHLFVFSNNKEAIDFWEQVGFICHFELNMMSSNT